MRGVLKGSTTLILRSFSKYKYFFFVWNAQAPSCAFASRPVQVRNQAAVNVVLNKLESTDVCRSASAGSDQCSGDNLINRAGKKSGNFRLALSPRSRMRGSETRKHQQIDKLPKTKFVFAKEEF